MTTDKSLIHSMVLILLHNTLTQYDAWLLFLETSQAPKTVKLLYTGSWCLGSLCLKSVRGTLI